jgi:hypothetical protein
MGDIDKLRSLADKFSTPGFTLSDMVEGVEFLEYSKGAKQTQERCPYCQWPRPSYRKTCKYCQRRFAE